jgi:hypothetical protein
MRNANGGLRHGVALQYYATGPSAKLRGTCTRVRQTSDDEVAQLGKQAGVTVLAHFGN